MCVKVERCGDGNQGWESEKRKRELSTLLWCNVYPYINEPLSNTQESVQASSICPSMKRINTISTENNEQEDKEKKKKTEYRELKNKQNKRRDQTAVWEWLMQHFIPLLNLRPFTD